VINIVADIFLIGEHLVNGSSRPGTPEVCQNPLGVQRRRDFRFRFFLLQEYSVDPANHLHLVIRPRDQNYPVRLQALLLAHFEHGLLLPGLVHEHPAETEPGSAALLETPLD